jgi:hypothetical protein
LSFQLVFYDYIIITGVVSCEHHLTIEQCNMFAYFSFQLFHQAMGL